MTDGAPTPCAPRESHAPNTIKGWANIARFLEAEGDDVRAWSRHRRDPLPLLQLNPVEADIGQLRAWRRRRTSPRCLALEALLHAAGAARAKIICQPGVYGLSFHGCDRVKIGYTSSIASRIDSLQTGMPYPIEVFAYAPAERRVETQLHVELAEYRRLGEWFEDCSEVRRILRELVLSTKGVML